MYSIETMYFLIVRAISSTGCNFLYVPEYSCMYVTVSCRFLISFVTEVYCTGWGGGGSAIRKLYRSSTLPQSRAMGPGINPLKSSVVALDFFGPQMALA
jgi:hypothetical protein